MGFVGFRRRIAEARLALEDDAPDLPMAPAPLALETGGAPLALDLLGGEE